VSGTRAIETKRDAEAARIEILSRLQEATAARVAALLDG
jgi:hypothetical protein